MTGTRRPAARRGLSTAVSFLIVFVGLFLAIGTLYSAAANTNERVADATDDQRDRHHAVQRTAVNVTNATWDDGAATLTVRVTNTGDATLSVPAADTVVDGTYVGIGDYERVEVAGRDSTHWAPGEELVLEDADTVDALGGEPGRVRFVTETGVADVLEVTAS